MNQQELEAKLQTYLNTVEPLRDSYADDEQYDFQVTMDNREWLSKGFTAGYQSALSEVERVREGEVMIRLSISDAATIHSWIESIVTCGVSKADRPVFERLAKAITIKP